VYAKIIFFLLSRVLAWIRERFFMNVNEHSFEFSYALLCETDLELI